MKKRKKANKDILDGLIGLTVLLAIYVYINTSSIPLAVISFLAPFVLIKLIQIYSKTKKNNQLKKSGIRDIDRMDGFQFEEYLSLLFREHGYKSKVTNSRGDYGADLTISKDGVTTVVQAKRYSSKVGIKAIQEIVSSMNYYKATKSMVITNNYFTKSAVEIAKTNNVELLNRDKLINMLLKLNPNGKTVDPIEVKKSFPPSCPTCKKEMIIRKGNNSSEFYGCSNFPSCKMTKTI